MLSGDLEIREVEVKSTSTRKRPLLIVFICGSLLFLGSAALIGIFAGDSREATASGSNFQDDLDTFTTSPSVSQSIFPSPVPSEKGSKGKNSKSPSKGKNSKSPSKGKNSKSPSKGKNSKSPSKGKTPSKGKGKYPSVSPSKGSPACPPVAAPTIYHGCFVSKPWKLGNGHCDGKEYNTEECDWDGGDCIDFNHNFPDCTVRNPWKVGNGICDGKYYNKKPCGYDGGDCKEFNKEYPKCGRKVLFPSWIGDGICDDDSPGYDTAICAYDGGDCDELKDLYPKCVGPLAWLNDCECDENLNNEDCGFDGGDCTIGNFFSCKHRSEPSKKDKHKFKKKHLATIPT